MIHGPGNPATDAGATPLGVPPNELPRDFVLPILPTLDSAGIESSGSQKEYTFAKGHGRNSIGLQVAAATRVLWTPMSRDQQQ